MTWDLSLKFEIKHSQESDYNPVLYNKVIEHLTANCPKQEQHFIVTDSLGNDVDITTDKWTTVKYILIYNYSTASATIDWPALTSNSLVLAPGKFFIITGFAVGAATWVRFQNGGGAPPADCEVLIFGS